MRSSAYNFKVQGAVFQEVIQKNVALAVARQTTANFVLKPFPAAQTATVTETAPLLDTTGASLGSEVTHEFVNRMPLANRDVTKLVYFSAGVARLKAHKNLTFPSFSA